MILSTIAVWVILWLALWGLIDLLDLLIGQRLLAMTEEEIKTEAKLVDQFTVCNPENQSKDKCTEFEGGRRNGKSWCFWYFAECEHCGNPKIQSHCLK